MRSRWMLLGAGLWLAAGGSYCKGRTPSVRVEPHLADQGKLRSNVQRIRKGWSVAKVVEALGQPSLIQRLAPKERPGPVRTELTYYVVRDDPKLVNEKRDRWLSVYIDSDGGVEHVWSNIDQLVIAPEFQAPDTGSAQKSS